MEAILLCLEENMYSKLKLLHQPSWSNVLFVNTNNGAMSNPLPHNYKWRLKFGKVYLILWATNWMRVGTALGLLPMSGVQSNPSLWIDTLTRTRNLRTPSTKPVWTLLSQVLFYRAFPIMDNFYDCWRNFAGAYLKNDRCFRLKQ